MKVSYLFQYILGDEFRFSECLGVPKIQAKHETLFEYSDNLSAFNFNYIYIYIATACFFAASNHHIHPWESQMVNFVAPKNGWLEDYLLIGMAYFQVLS